MKKQIVHYWMINSYAACGCWLVKDTINRRKVTCKRCRKTVMFKTEGRVKRVPKRR